MRKLTTGLAALGIALLVALPAMASTTTISTPSGSVIGTEPVSASATITTSNGKIVVLIENDQTNFHSATQVLSDFSLTLSGAPSSDASLDATSVGTLTFVNSDGSTTAGGTDNPGWVVTTAGTTIHVDGLAGGSSNNPAYTIIGPDDGTGNYPNANASIAGNGPHNPFFTGVVEFDLSVPGVTYLTTITGMTFSFSTASGNDITGGGGTPEPASIALMGLGVLALGYFTMRKREENPLTIA